MTALVVLHLSRLQAVLSTTHIHHLILLTLAIQHLIIDRLVILELVLLVEGRGHGSLMVNLLFLQM